MKDQWRRYYEGQTKNIAFYLYSPHWAEEVEEEDKESLIRGDRGPPKTVMLWNK